MNQRGKLVFFCGKMAAGKSTLAKKIAQQENAVLLEQDQLLDALFPGEISEISDYINYAARLETALSPHICSLLEKGVSVVLDFPGNTRKQRAWFRKLFEQAKADHELHYVDVPDEICKVQLKERSKELPEGSAFTTDAEFDAITAYFQAPSDDENFNIIHHPRSHL